MRACRLSRTSGSLGRNGMRMVGSRRLREARYTSPMLNRVARTTQMRYGLSYPAGKALTGTDSTCSPSRKRSISTKFTPLQQVGLLVAILSPARPLLVRKADDLDCRNNPVPRAGIDNVDRTFRSRLVLQRYQQGLIFRLCHGYAAASSLRGFAERTLHNANVRIESAHSFIFHLNRDVFLHPDTKITGQLPAKLIARPSR